MYYFRSNCLQQINTIHIEIKPCNPDSDATLTISVKFRVFKPKLVKSVKHIRMFFIKLQVTMLNTVFK